MKNSKRREKINAHTNRTEMSTAVTAGCHNPVHSNQQRSLYANMHDSHMCRSLCIAVVLCICGRTATTQLMKIKNYEPSTPFHSIFVQLRDASIYGFRWHFTLTTFFCLIFCCWCRHRWMFVDFILLFSVIGRVYVCVCVSARLSHISNSFSFDDFSDANNFFFLAHRRRRLFVHFNCIVCHVHASCKLKLNWHASKLSSIGKFQLVIAIQLDFDGLSILE